MSAEGAANVLVRPLSIISEGPQQAGEVAEHWKNANACPAFKKGKRQDLESYVPVSPTLTPGKVMGQVILRIISKWVEDKRVTGSSEHGFMKRRSCLTDLVAFFGELNQWMRGQQGILYLKFSKAFDTVSHNILRHNLII